MRIEDIDKDVFTALSYLGFHLEQKLNKYIKCLPNIIVFRTHSHFLG